VGLWEVVVPSLSVVVTGGAAIWSKIIDARAREKDREHAGKDRVYWRARLIQGLSEFRNRVGDEEGISEITAYAAEPVRDALDEMLELINERLRPHRLHLLILKKAEAELELLAQKSKDEDSDSATDATNRLQERSSLREKRSKYIEEIGTTADVAPDEVIKLCDRIIDVARQDLQGRY
jgi:hypothetical protein